MVTRAQIQRLRARIEALTPPRVQTYEGARERLASLLEAIAGRLASTGQDWPPSISPDARAAIFGRLRERLESAHANST